MTSLCLPTLLAWQVFHNSTILSFRESQMPRLEIARALCALRRGPNVCVQQRDLRFFARAAASPQHFAGRGRQLLALPPRGQRLVRRRSSSPLHPASLFLLPVPTAHITAAIFCTHPPSHRAVRNPPVMPSKYVRVPRKQPDKMGFDEVSKDVEMEDGVCKKTSPSLVCFFNPRHQESESSLSLLSPPT